MAEAMREEFRWIEGLRRGDGTCPPEGTGLIVKMTTSVSSLDRAKTVKERLAGGVVIRRARGAEE
jgi:hypothetical protein